MYYYILEYAQSAIFNNFQKKVKQTLTNLNIAGEMAVASPARSAEELAQIALDRGYTTIVAVGSDLLVNRLASTLAGSQAALGVIPFNLSDELGGIFTGKDAGGACQALRSRKTRLIDLGKIHPNKYFLSDAIIKSDIPIKLTLEIDDEYSLKAEIYRLSINKNLQVIFSTEPPKKKTWWGSGGAYQESSITQLHGNNHINIYTTSPISVLVSDHEVVKTPMQVTTAKEVLKIITNRDTIN